MDLPVFASSGRSSPLVEVAVFSFLGGKKRRFQHRGQDGELHLNFSSSARRVRIGFNSSPASFSVQPSTMRFPSS
jgi:hypothetical protein